MTCCKDCYSDEADCTNACACHHAPHQNEAEWDGLGVSEIKDFVRRNYISRTQIAEVVEGMKSTPHYPAATKNANVVIGWNAALEALKAKLINPK